MIFGDMTIGMIYAALFGLGVVYALLATVFGWIADHDFGNLHVDAAGNVDQPHPISGTVVATFITGFGGGGVIAHYLLDWKLAGGLLAATATGVVLAGAAFGILELIFSRTQAGSEFKSDDAVGRTAEVITNIPAAGIGEIAYVVKGQRLRAGARVVGGAAVQRGAAVRIERMTGTTATVRLQKDGGGDELQPEKGASP